MRFPLFALALAAAMLLPSSPAQAHHSFGGTYNVDKEITIKGKMVEVSVRSPHSFLYVEMVDANGTAQRWAIEGGSATQFASQFAKGSANKDAFKIGDPVEIIANPARSPNSTRARLIKITRTTDGKSWGTAPGETVE
jgi:Family of unknown function (DUF6152)